MSNSWGVHRYPHELFEELFDGIVITGQEGMRKPSPRMYELGAERAGVRAGLCVFVDDLPFNLPPAESWAWPPCTTPQPRPRSPSLSDCSGSR